MKKTLNLLLAVVAACGLAFAGTAVAQQKADPKKEAAPKAEAKKEEPKKTAAAEPLDINSASEKELATLKGIGEARAAAIVKGRPYRGKDDLLKKKVIPENVYNDIKDQIIAKQDASRKDEKKK